MKFRKFGTIVFFFSLIVQVIGQQWVEENTSLGNVVDIIENDGKLYTLSNLGLFSFSEDNGENWTIKDIRNVSNIDNPIFMTVAFFDNEHGIIGIRTVGLAHQLLFTEDSGASWSILEHEHHTNCSEGLIPLKITVINDTTAILAPLNSSEMRITRNLGISWECIDSFISPAAPQELEIRNEKEWFYNDLIGLNYTEDAGQTWNVIIKQNFIDYQLFGDSTIFALTTYFDSPNNIPILYSSNDNFATYDSISLDMFTQEYINQFVVVSDDEIFMLIGNKVYFSKDHAQSFKLIQELNNEPFRTAFINNEWYLSGRGLWKLDSDLSKVQNIIQEKLQFYPNPVVDIINVIQSQFKNYNIISLDGKIIDSGHIFDTSINVEHLHSGMYFLQLYDVKNSVTLSFFKK